MDGEGDEAEQARGPSRPWLPATPGERALAEVRGADGSGATRAPLRAAAEFAVRWDAAFGRPGMPGCLELLGDRELIAALHSLAVQPAADTALTQESARSAPAVGHAQVLGSAGLLDGSRPPRLTRAARLLGALKLLLASAEAEQVRVEEPLAAAALWADVKLLAPAVDMAPALDGAFALYLSGPPRTGRLLCLRARAGRLHVEPDAAEESLRGCAFAPTRTWLRALAGGRLDGIAAAGDAVALSQIVAAVAARTGAGGTWQAHDDGGDTRAVA
jgi:hypothetical protein